MDRHERPQHNLSSRKAKTRGFKSVFASLAGEGKAILFGLKVDEQAENLRQINKKIGNGTLHWVRRGGGWG